MPKRCIAVNGGIYLQGTNGVTIGEDTWIGPGVKIISANHNSDDLRLHDAASPVTIGRHCWIGSNAVVLPGVKIGDNSTVGAGAVVVKDVPPGVVVVGVPARQVKSR